MRSSYDYRKDERDDDEFEEDIQYYSDLEEKLFPEWCERVVKQRFFKKIIWQSNGVDNTGKVIRGRHARMSEPDFLVEFVGRRMPLTGIFKVESKYDPVLTKATYKDDNLNAYVGHDALMLTIFGDFDGNPKAWTLVGPRQMQIILDELPRRRYKREIGNKWGRQLQRWKGHFERYFGPIYTWDGVRLEGQADWRRHLS